MRVAVSAIVLAIGCDRGHPRDQAPTPTPSAPPSAASSAGRDACTLADLALRLPAPRRLVAIGDLHGDLAATKSALRAAGAIDGTDHWSGGDLVVVQTGDVLDRGDDEQEILDLLFRLEEEAKAAGGALVLLIGNHELMNAAGDFRYVTRGAITDFDGKRAQELGPGGIYAKKIAAHNVIAIIGDTVFSHAGVRAEWATRLDQINRGSRCWLDGQAGGPQAAPIALTSDESPVWTRVFGTDRVDCGEVTPVFAALGVKRMVVGHTVQATINSACDGTLWRIDVGLAKNYDGPIEVLEVLPAPRVLRGTR